VVLVSRSLIASVVLVGMGDEAPLLPPPKGCTGRGGSGGPGSFRRGCGAIVDAGIHADADADDTANDIVVVVLRGR